MPIRDKVTWGNKNPLSDPRYADLDAYVNALRRGKIPRNVTAGKVFENRDGDLPGRPYAYYSEYDVTPTVDGVRRDSYRIVLGGGGEVYITGSHYHDLRQIVNMPMAEPPNSFAARLEADRNRALDRLEDNRKRLSNLMRRMRGEHGYQTTLLTDTSSLSAAAVGFAGDVTNEPFNGPIPDLLIWNEAERNLEAARNAIRMRSVKKAIRDLYRARVHYLVATHKYTKWKSGLPSAGAKMQWAIGETSIMQVAAAVAAAVASAAFVSSGAPGAEGAAADETVMRIAALVERADFVVRIAEAASLVEEAAAAREFERALAELSRLEM